MKNKLSERLHRLKVNSPTELLTRLLAITVMHFGFIFAYGDGFNAEYIEVPTYGQGNDIPARNRELKSSIGICGTNVIQVLYTGDVDYRIQSAFEYACRIWEDFIPMGYPIKVTVSQEALPTTPKPMLSKVKIRAFDVTSDANSDNLGTLVTLSKIKSVYFKEYGNHTQLAGFASAPLALSLPDFHVTYNTDCLNMFEFNENSSSTGTYDFVSLAIRNIAQGLGFACAFDADTEKQTMIPLSREKLPFESIITRFNTYSYSRYVNENNYIQTIVGSNYTTEKLQFTPVRVWEKGTTLCGFLPNESVGLTYALGEGISYNTLIREIEDSKFANYFHAYLKWPQNYEQSTHKIIGKSDINPNDKGNIDVDLSSALTKNFREYFHIKENGSSVGASTNTFSEIDKLIKPFLVPAETDGIYLQKTNGEWLFVFAAYDDNPFKIDPDTFDHETIAKNRNGEYRLAIVDGGSGGLSSVACLPGPAPKVGMSVVSSLKRTKYYTTIGLKATEGLSKLEIKETVRSSSGLTTTSTFEVAPGTRSLVRTYPDGSSVTLTPYSYKNSGEATKGNTISFSYAQLSLPLVSSVNINNNNITFNIDPDNENCESPLQYSLTPLNNLSAQPVEEGDFTDDTVIDISRLSPGLYVLKYQSGDGWETKTFTKN